MTAYLNYFYADLPKSDTQGRAYADMAFTDSDMVVSLSFDYDLDEWEVKNIKVENPSWTERDFDAVAELEAPDVEHRILTDLRRFVNYVAPEIVSRMKEAA